MVNPQLIDYVRDVRSKGYSDEQIKNHLISHGYSKDNIDEAFLLLSTNMQQNIEKREQKKEVVVKKTKKNNSILVIIDILAVKVFLYQFIK